jgi:hypothetical protein
MTEDENMMLDGKKNYGDDMNHTMMEMSSGILVPFLPESIVPPSTVMGGSFANEMVHSPCGRPTHEHPLGRPTVSHLQGIEG